MAIERQRRRSNQSVTIRDVAAHVGVSPMTVSRVINRESNVKPETRELVHAAIRALNYAPSPAARSRSAAPTAAGAALTAIVRLPKGSVSKPDSCNSSAMRA